MKIMDSSSIMRCVIAEDSGYQEYIEMLELKTVDSRILRCGIAEYSG